MVHIFILSGFSIWTIPKNIWDRSEVLENANLDNQGINWNRNYLKSAERENSTRQLNQVNDCSLALNWIPRFLAMKVQKGKYHGSFISSLSEESTHIGLQKQVYFYRKKKEWYHVSLCKKHQKVQWTIFSTITLQKTKKHCSQIGHSCLDPLKNCWL